MKNIYTLFILLSVTFFKIESKTQIIVNNNNAFSPASITINSGDTIQFNIGSTHNAVEVSKDAYDKNDSTGNGGFRVPFGGGKIVLNNPGTYYYVCSPHVKLGMKGTITVNTATAIHEKNLSSDLILVPNPAESYVNIRVNLKSGTKSNIKIYDLLGSLVKEQSNIYLNSGQNSYRLLLNGELKSGKYILQLNTGTESISRPLIVK